MKLRRPTQIATPVPETRWWRRAQPGRRPLPSAGADQVATGRFWAATAGLYAVAVLLATYPRALHLATHLPTLADPATHLWTLRWYRACLLEGRFPLFNPDLQAPLGFPMGLVPPLPLHALGFVVLRALIPNDVLCYNLLWLIGFVLTGLGTCALAWRLTGDRVAAVVGGLAAMLSAPLMLHGFEHLELICVGAFPVFLWHWVRFVDAPGRGRLLPAAGWYLLLAGSAPYFGVLAVFPAALYVVCRGARGLGDVARWLNLAGWLAGFALAVLPGLAVFFAPQLWAAWQGHAVTRSRSEFLTYGTTVWSYVVPSQLHALGRLLPFDVQAAAGFDWRLREKTSYLGVVVVLLVQVAAICQVRLPRRGFWWACLGLLVLLSLGGECRVGERVIGLPAGWAFDHLPGMRLLRVPARFNLFAAVVAAVLAAAGLAALRAAIQRRWMRDGLAAACALGVVLDLAIVPYGVAELPVLPSSYAWIAARAPGAVLLEIPQTYSAHNFEVSPVAAYWQSRHRGRTTAGYGAHGSPALDALYNYASPFNVFELRRPDFLAETDRIRLGPFANLRFRDYAWLYAQTHGFPYVVLHRWLPDPGLAAAIERIEAQLAPGQVYSDERTAVYETARLGPAREAVPLPLEGWGPQLPCQGRSVRTIGRSSRLAIWWPAGGGDGWLSVEAAALRGALGVEVVCDGQVIGHWRFPADAFREQRIPLAGLPAGLHTIELRCERADRAPEPLLDEREPRRYSLRVSAVAVGLAQRAASAVPVP